MVKVIVNADDFGYSRGINFGIIDCYKRGVLTSGTLMTNMPGFEHAVELANENPGFGVGIHMVLTAQGPVLDTHKIIADPKTGMFRKQKEYRDGSIVFDAETIAEIEAEYRAQIQKAIDAGIEFTHLDSHHHMHAVYPAIQEIAYRLATEYNVPLRKIVGLNDETFPDTIPAIDFFERHFDLIGDGTMNAEEVSAYYAEVLENIQKYDVVEIMTHPGYLDALVYTNSSYYETRVHQVDALTTGPFAEALRDTAKYELVTYAVLKDKE